MKCDECKEQVFELIEREAVDPEGVREILARCPDCRTAFDEMKAALAVVEQLPIEEPAAAVDAAILRAAAVRATRVTPARKRRLQAPPWAMAAIALLAVGVGVWSIPRAVQLEGDAAPTETKNADEAIMAEPMLDEKVEIEDVVAQAEPASAPTVGGRSAAPPEPARAKRRSSSAADERRADRTAEAPASQLAADPAAGAAAESWSAEADSTASLAREQKRGDDDAASCKRKVDEIERRKRAAKDYVPKPEEELEIGKCYLTLDRGAEARKWLQRAAAHLETKARAEEALRELGPK
jgi:hypothetical protein